MASYNVLSAIIGAIFLTEKPDNKRELSKLKDWDKREKDWLEVRKRLRISGYGRKDVINANEPWHKHPSYKLYRTIWVNKFKRTKS